MPIEGVILQIVNGVAVFTSGLNGSILTSKRLSDFETMQDVGWGVIALDARVRYSQF